MPFGSTSRRFGMLLSAVAACVILAVLLPVRAMAIPELFVRVQNTTGPAGAQNSAISVYLNNRVDSIAGFSVWLRMNRPDIARFQIDTQLVSDTTYWRCQAYNGSNCIDSVAIPKESLGVGPNTFRHIKDTNVTIGNISTVGSLIQGWDLVRTRSVSGQGTDILVTALHSTELTPPQLPPPMGTRTNEGLLFTLLADILPIPDTMTNRTVEISIEHDFLDKFIFSRPNGTAIGIYNVPTLDTLCWRCTNWVGQTCTDSIQSSLPPCDWETYVIKQVPTLDTTKVVIIDGTLTVDASCCVQPSRGNVDMAGIVDLGDLAFLVDYLSPPAGPSLPCEKEANIDGQGIVDLGDLAFLVDYLSPPAGPTLPPCP